MNKILGFAFALLITVPAVTFASDTLRMKDGTEHVGTFVSASATTIAFKEGRTVHHYKRTSVQSVEFSSGSTATSEEMASSRKTAARNVELPAGTEIAVLKNQAIDSKTATSGQTFSADVANNVTDSNGGVVIPKGSPAELVLRQVSGGGVTGTSQLTLDLQSVKVGDHRYMVNTQTVEQKGSEGIGANKRTAEMVGGGAALGTLIGAIAGQGKGAAIGAVAGAAAGAGTQILTRGKTVSVPAETTLRFKLDQPLQLQMAY